MATFDAFRFIDLIAPRPLLMITAKKAVTAWMTHEAHERTGILDNSGLMLDAALAGMGLGYLAEQTVAPLVDEGRLIRMRADWMPQEPPLCLYYSGRRHVPAKLRAFIDLI